MAESDFLEFLRRSSSATPAVPIPIGDDLAALRWPAGQLLLVGADQVLDGVHVDLRVHPPRAIGAKAMNRNLSDCAAMACVPVAAVVTLALPAGGGEAMAREIVAGVRDAGARFGCAVVGGDTGSWPGPLAVSVSVLGRSAGIDPVTRAGARPGDKLYVTGPLGGSIRGRHMTFTPRVELSLELASRFELHAMLDLSDGLSRDLPRLCAASGCGAMLDAARIPIHNDAHAMNDGQPPLEHALHDGEDYELLFASPGCDHPHAIEIGEVLPGATGAWIRDGKSAMPLAPCGWDHAL